MKRILALAAWVIAFEIVSFLIGRATQGDVAGWYQTLRHPPLTPPDIVFPFAWTTLYALIAAAGHRLWQERKSGHGPMLLSLFAGYMALNWSWSFVFFGMHAPLTGLIWITLMNIAALVIIARAWRPVRVAALLFIPPTLWTFFALYLNAGVLLLN